MLGGTEDVYSGGAADYSYIYGAEIISSGGSSYGATVHSGGNLYVSSGGVDSASVISSGGKETVYKGGYAHVDEVASGATQYDYGVTSGTSISKGGTEDVFSGAAADTSQIYGSELRLLRWLDLRRYGP